jgi:pimeloyl-ACP methyl ester carboxylesterase
MKKAAKVTFWTLGTLVLVCTLFIIALWWNSPGKPAAYFDNEGNPIKKSIAEIRELTLQGVRQTVIIQGEDSTKPVLLYLHGGPGGTSMGLRLSNRYLEKDFVVVYWDQLGCGKSYYKGIAPENMTLPALVDYTLALSDYLSERFGQDKIYLMGESWGTVLSMHALQKQPERYLAYFGVGSVIHIYRSEAVSLAWLKEEVVSRGDKEDIQIVSDLTLPDSTASHTEWDSYLQLQRRFLYDYGGVFANPPSGLQPTRAFFFDKAYTLSEKFNMKKGMDFSFNYLSPYVKSINFLETIDTIAVPSYFLQGRQDYTTPTSIVELFYQKIKAPKKALILFDHSAHMPHNEEPEKFAQILRELAQ